MHESTHSPEAGNGSQADHKRNNNAIQTRKFSQYITRSAGKSKQINFLGSNFPQDYLYLGISFFMSLGTMLSSQTFTFVPGVKSAEKLLREHEVETITNFVTYYSYGVGKGKSKVRGAPQMNSGYERDAGV